MKTVIFSFIAALLLSGCTIKNAEPQLPLKGVAQKVEIKDEIRDQLNLQKPPVVQLQTAEKIAVLRPETPTRAEEKIMRGLMLPYNQGSTKWGGQYVYDILKEKSWKFENEPKDSVNPSFMGGIN